MMHITDYKSGKVYEEDTLLKLISAKEKKLAEQTLTPKLFRSSPEEFQIELTRKCNLKCVFCYNQSGKANHDELSDEKLLDVIQQAIEMNVKVITFSGGEIFTRRSTLYKCLELCFSNKVLINLITNGTLIHEGDIEFLSKNRAYVNMIQISIDGASGEIHDALRGIDGSWEKSIQSIYRLLDNHLPVKVVSVISTTNFDQIYPLAELIYLLGAKELQFGVVIKRGRAVNTECSLSLEQYQEFSGIISELHNYYQGKVNIYSSQPIQFVEKKIRLSPLKSFEIRVNGDVYKTCTSDTCFGSIRDKKLQEMWTLCSDKWNDLRTSEVQDDATEYIKGAK